jgi:hypothetical protein
VIGRQLQADACRGRYIIDGVEFWFAKESRSSESCENTGHAFSERLRMAVVRCVEGRHRRGHGQPPVPDGLLNTIMLLITQIGLALASVACAGPRLALCGGLREITYELQRVNSETWEIQGKFRAAGFKFYQEAGSLDTASACDPISSMTREFAVRLILSAEHPVGFYIDVQDVFECIDIIDLRGLPVTLESCLSELGCTPTQQGHQQGVFARCSVGRCMAPQHETGTFFGGSEVRKSLWAQISGACVAPDTYQETTVSEVRVN